MDTLNPAIPRTPARRSLAAADKNVHECKCIGPSVLHCSCGHAPIRGAKPTITTEPPGVASLHLGVNFPAAFRAGVAHAGGVLVVARIPIHQSSMFFS